MLESRMVASARREAGVDRGDRRAAGAHLLADALVDQHVGIDRDADGEHDAGDAGQRQRRVEQRQHAEDHRDVDRDRDVGEQAEQAVGHQHEDDHHAPRRRKTTVLPLAIEVLAEAGADGALLDDGERRRQRAGAQQDGEVVGALHGEVAGNLPEPPRIGSRITGAEITSLSSTMANGLPTFSCVTWAKLRAPRGVEAEGDDRLAGALVEAGLRVGQVLARDEDALLDHVRLPWFLAGAVEHFVVRRHVGPAAPAPAARLTSTMRKSSLAVLPSSSFSRVGSCRPGTCTRMRSVPWRWINGSTVPSSLTRRSMIWIDCSTACRMRSTIAGSVTVSRISRCRHRDVERALAGGAEDAAERLRQLAQLGERRLDLVAPRGCAPRRCCRGPPGRCSRRARRAARAARRRAALRSFSLRTALVSTSSRMCEPPCRSSPSTTWRCAHFGQLCTVFSEKKFGTANRQTTSAVSTIAVAFHRVK